ncbi:carboxypeptidase-like regulatory domain-containing protein [Streptomyces sp. NPDC058664]|uniref:carboxypeptidase-like regulatory domain-containing protein n=1 Tax=unclassified Streptomyces TaxID=2593676 RepID=UPI0036599075
MIAATAILALSSCEEPGGEVSSIGGQGVDRSAAVKPQTLTGRVTTVDGKPLKGVKVYAGNPLWDRAYVAGGKTTATDEEGSYTIPELRSSQVYKTFAWMPLKYRGKDFCLRVSPATPEGYTEFPGSKGAVRDFTWKLHGKIQDSSEEGYYGGSIQIFPNFTDGNYKGKVELQLTPTSLLADGSHGNPLSRIANLGPNMALDIPLGAYKVSATRIKEDGTRAPLKVGTSSSPSASRYANIEFEPEYQLACKAGPGNSSGIARAYLNVMG